MITKFCSNYFSVKNEHEFEAMMRVAGFALEDGTLFCKTTHDGNKRYSFRGEEQLAGGILKDEFLLYAEEVDEELAYYEPEEVFCIILQKHVRAGDCIVMQRIETDEPCYLSADVCFITPKEIQYTSLYDITEEMTQKLMGPTFYVEYNY